MLVEFYEFNLCNQSLKITFDDCDCLPFDLFFRAVFFLTDSKLVSFLAGYYGKNGHLQYLLTE